MVFSNNLLLGAAGQSTGAAPFDSTLIGNSVWLDGSADFLKRDNFTLSADGKKEFIFSMWIQRNEFGRAQTHFDLIPTGHTSYNDGTHFIFAADDQIEFSVATGGSSGGKKSTTAVYRDIGWYHVLVSYNTNTSVVATSRHRVFVNGLEISDTSAYTAPPDNQSCIGSGTGNADLRIGRTDHSGIPYPSNAYFAQACYLEGKSFQAGDFAITDFLDTFTFGTNGSQFVPKADAAIAALASTVGGNSFCLDFANSSDLGNDISSNNKDFTATNMTSANQSYNSPSDVVPKFNPLQNLGATLSEGNSRITLNNSVFGTQPITINLPDTGKWYGEFLLNATAQSDTGIGLLLDIADKTVNLVNPASAADYPNRNNDYYLLQLSDGNKINGDISGSSYGSATASGETAQWAYDAATRKLWFGNEGTFFNSGDPAAGSNEAFTLSASDTITLIVWDASNARTADVTMRNHSSDFEHTPPTGFKSLESKNLTAPTYQGIDYFTPTLYRGNGEGQRVGDFVPFTDVGTITKSFLSDGGTNTGTTDLRIANSVSTAPTSLNAQVKTLSVWIKPCSIREQFIYIGNGTSDNSERLYTSSTGAVQYLTRNGGSSPASVTTAGNLVNDTSQWVHLVYALDYRDGTTEADRVKLYVNGIRQTTTGTQPANNMTAQAYINKASTEQIIGTHPDFTTAGNRMDAYLAEMYMVDGTMLDPSTFGVLDTSTNKWLPKSPTTIKAAVTFGNCGFYLDFLDGSNLGDDDSGNNRDFTESATIGTANQFIDTPSQNFATLDTTYGYSNTTYSKGNLAVVGASVASQQNKTTYSTAFSKKSGKWWVEFDSILDAGGTTVLYGIIPTQYIRDGSFVAAAKDASTGYADNLKGSIRAYIVGSTYGNKVYDISIGTGSGVTSFTSGGIINNNAGGYTDLVPYGIALDMDNKKMWIGNPTISATTWNNETSVSPAANTGGFDLEFDEYSIFISNSQGTSFINFGQYVGSWNGNSVTDHTSTAGGNFTLAPPTDFKAINQDNLDDTASKLTALAWIKNRDATDNHMLFDRVRGVGNDLHSNDPAAQVFNANTVQRFLQRGVQVGSDVEVNTANESYVLWQWLLGDSATTGSTNADGSVNTTVIAADAGHFSIVTGTTGGSGATFGHGLGAAPDLILNKNLNNTDGWLVYSSAFDSADNYMQLNATNSVFTGSTVWGTDATATVFTLGSFFVNVECIAYCFRSVPGVCKVGSYTGNGDGATATGYNGPYIELGFKPSFILLKRIDAANSWILQDTVRHTLNPVDNYLQAESTSAETATTGNVDFLSSGLKIRTGNGNAWNASGGKYIYLAMADIGGNGTLPPVYGR